MTLKWGDRRKLPDRRRAHTFEVTFGKQNNAYQVTVGHYDFNRHSPGEVFVSGAKAGSEMDALTRDGSVLLSIALQYGANIDVIKKAVTRERNNEPSTVIGLTVDILAHDTLKAVK